MQWDTVQKQERKTKQKNPKQTGEKNHPKTSSDSNQDNFGYSEENEP